MGWEGFSLYIRFEVGLEDRGQFWHDQWCGDQPLKLAFSLLIAITSNREASVEHVLVRQNMGERRSWDV